MDAVALVDAVLLFCLVSVALLGVAIVIVHVVVVAIRNWSWSAFSSLM